MHSLIYYGLKGCIKNKISKNNIKEVRNKIQISNPAEIFFSPTTVQWLSVIKVDDYCLKHTWQHSVTKENENSRVNTFYCEWNNINILDLYFQRKGFSIPSWTIKIASVAFSTTRRYFSSLGFKDSFNTQFALLKRLNLGNITNIALY
jgi:hypothetical protein